MNADVQLILVAGGMGTRLGHALPKALVPINGTPLIVRTLQAFEDAQLAQSAIIVHPADFREAFAHAVEATFPEHTCTLIAGGAERSDSVRQGLAVLSSTTHIVLIHDAARPFVTHSAIEASIETARRDGAVTVACACKDTVLQVDEHDKLRETPPRSSLRLCQTPQAFQRDIIESAYSASSGIELTDDASLVQKMGVPVSVIDSSERNIKITTPQDIEYAEFLLKKGLV